MKKFIPVLTGLLVFGLPSDMYKERNQKQEYYLERTFQKRTVESYEPEEVYMYSAIRPYQKKIENYSRILESEELIPYYLALLYGESSGRPNAKSKKGAYGLFQIKFDGAFSWAWEFMHDHKRREKYPEIAKLLSDMEGDKMEMWKKVKTDPDLNIRIGMAYFYFLWNFNEKNIDEALKDYGLGRRGKKRNPKAAKKYVNYINTHYLRVQKLLSQK